MEKPPLLDSETAVDPLRAARQLSAPASHIEIEPGRDVSEAAYATIQWPPDETIEPVVVLQVSITGVETDAPDGTVVFRHVPCEEVIHPHLTPFSPPLEDCGHSDATSFRRYWEKLSFVFEIPDPEGFPAIGVDEDKREIANRFVQMCHRMADFTVINQESTLLVWEGADGWNIAIDSYPTDETFLGTSAVFRQLHNEQEEASFSKIWNALSKTAAALPAPRRADALAVLKQWKTARGALMKHTLHSLTAAKVSGAKLDADPPVSFGNIKPDELIRLFNYGDTLHFGERRQELVSLLEDGFEEAYFRYGALISILGLSHLYFGFAVLVDSALREIA